jgi:hypothetical protein
VEVGRRTIAFAGLVTRVDKETLATELSRVGDERGEIDGRTVCVSVGTLEGNATYIGDSIPAAAQVLNELSGNATFRALWGGGGLTVLGSMHRADVSLLSSGTFPASFRSTSMRLASLRTYLRRYESKLSASASPLLVWRRLNSSILKLA